MAAIETYWEHDEWHNRRQGEAEPFGSAKTKEAAQEAGRLAAIEEGAEHIIKNQSGQIAERSSYGNDPRDIPG